eukprot:7115179-Prymnesium_polylepis.2
MLGAIDSAINEHALYDDRSGSRRGDGRGQRLVGDCRDMADESTSGWAIVVGLQLDDPWCIVRKRYAQQLVKRERAVVERGVVAELVVYSQRRLTASHLGLAGACLFWRMKRAVDLPMRSLAVLVGARDVRLLPIAFVPGLGTVSPGWLLRGRTVARAHTRLAWVTATPPTASTVPSTRWCGSDLGGSIAAVASSLTLEGGQCLMNNLD